METEIIVAPTLEALRAALNRLHEKGIPLDQIKWWGWDGETIETSAHFRIWNSQVHRILRGQSRSAE